MHCRWLYHGRKKVFSSNGRCCITRGRWDNAPAGQGQLLHPIQTMLYCARHLTCRGKVCPCTVYTRCTCFLICGSQSCTCILRSSHDANGPHQFWPLVPFSRCHKAVACFPHLSHSATKSSTFHMLLWWMMGCGRENGAMPHAKWHDIYKGTIALLGLMPTRSRWGVYFWGLCKGVWQRVAQIL